MSMIESITRSSSTDDDKFLESWIGIFLALSNQCSYALAVNLKKSTILLSVLMIRQNTFFKKYCDVEMTLIHHWLQRTGSKKI